MSPSITSPLQQTPHLENGQKPNEHEPHGWQWTLSLSTAASLVPFQDKESLRLGFSISKALVVTAKASGKYSPQEHPILMYEIILLDAGCLPPSLEFALLKKIATLSQFQGHQRL